jgi:hypothetical protein
MKTIGEFECPKGPSVPTSASGARTIKGFSTVVSVDDGSPRTEAMNWAAPSAQVIASYRTRLSQSRTELAAWLVVRKVAITIGVERLSLERPQWPQSARL